VGSRESLLAVAQSMTLVDYLRRALPNVEVTLMTMKTTGDRIQDRTLDKVGGKGLFVKELDAALREGRADLSVHSLKDVPMQTPEDLPLVGFSRREDPRDALVLPEGVRALKRGGVIGTSSLRRALQLKKLFPECGIRPVRGNLQTRLSKLDEGQFDAIVLAAAGIRLIGDINSDGTVDRADAAVLQQFLLTARMLSEQQAVLADLSGDEKITAVDLSLLKQILLS
jgi:hydroxymethylbilane synthase